MNNEFRDESCEELHDESHDESCDESCSESRNEPCNEPFGESFSEFRNEPCSESPQNHKRLELLSGHPMFPTELAELDEPVRLLHCIGNDALLKAPAIAIVGARKATPYGLSCAHRFGRRAAQTGIVVVSGGAVGCDQAAHRGALEGGGQTIVVLGCGADVIYPTRAQALFNEVLTRGGAIVSEAPWGAPPSRWAFRKRNRIIAGLGWATLIVEAGLPSGTFSTADATLAQGKDVLVVPGSIDSRDSRGSNRLLLQGATPIIDLESFDDALAVIFDWHKTPCASAAPVAEDSAALYPYTNAPLLTNNETRILRACVAHPMRPEELAAACSMDLLELIRALSILEIKRRVTRMRDGRYAVL